MRNEKVFARVAFVAWNFAGERNPHKASWSFVENAKYRARGF